MASVSQKSLAIIGQGYVGLPLAMAAVTAGWNVIGLDNSKSRVGTLNKGQSPVEDISDFTLSSALKSGKYKVTSNYADISNADVVTICVPTPLDEKKQPDLAALRGATSSAAQFLKNGALLVSESTSYPGTLRNEVIPLIEKNRATGAVNLYFAAAPERVNPGDAIWDIKNTPRLVSGLDKKSHEKALEFYQSICDEVVSVESPEIAEAAKLLENTFRLVNIGLANEFTKLCDSAGIDVNKVISAAASKPYGFMPFRPGVGVGGHCIPVDPLYLTWWARQNGGEATFVESADRINHEMPRYVAERALSMVDGSIVNPKVLILGVAYKPGVGDVRETPVTELRSYLQDRGASVAWHDPMVPIWEGTNPVDLDWDCDVAILATNQPGLDFSRLVANGVQILDCTNSITGKSGVISI